MLEFLEILKEFTLLFAGFVLGIIGKPIKRLLGKNTTKHELKIILDVKTKILIERLLSDYLKIKMRLGKLDNKDFELILRGCQIAPLESDQLFKKFKKGLTPNDIDYLNNTLNFNGKKNDPAFIFSKIDIFEIPQIDNTTFLSKDKFKQYYEISHLVSLLNSDFEMNNTLVWKTYDSSVSDHNHSEISKKIDSMNESIHKRIKIILEKCYDFIQ